MVQVRAPDVVPTAPARRPGVSRLLPAALVVLLAVMVLHAGGVPLPGIGTFAAYVLLGLTLPGTLWWRALSGAPRSLPADLAAGTALGYALEVLAYIPARWLDVPHAHLAWVAATYLAFCAVPALRRHWTAPGGTPRAPAGWSWAMAGLAGFSLLYSAVTFFPGHGLTWPGNGAPYIDMPYHLALAGDVKHHVPAMFPYVTGEALHDHWFVYADLAATSWTTGLELETLLYRLSPVPMIMAFTVLVAVLTHRLTGRRKAGVAAVAAMFFVVAPDPYGWKGGIGSSAGEPALPWVSPTQTFGALLFAPLALLLIDLVRRPRGRHGRWAPVAVLMLAEAGAKATYLPLALAGVTLVLALHLIAHRRIHRTAAALTALCLGLLAFAQIVLFHGEDKGLRISPLHFMRWHEAYRVSGAGLLLPGRPEPAPLVLLVVAIHVVSWAALWGGAARALRRWRDDPAVVLLAGIGLAGLAATCVFGHPGLSQGYFLASAAPYLTLLTVTALWPRPRPADPVPTDAGLSPGRRWPSVAVPVAGALTAWAVQAWSGDVPPQGAAVVAGRAAPYGLLVGAALAVAPALVLAGRRAQVWWAVPVFALGYGLCSGVPQRLEPFWDAPRPVTAPARPQIPEGGTTAARWLRDHSSPDALVAVNAHCRAPSGTCDSRHFWISAYAERRTLVEGWGYVNGGNSRAALLGPPTMGTVPFAFPRRLADNDAAFLHPAPDTVGRLRDAYGVRWLFTDDRYPVRTAALGRVAVLRFRSGHCRVYELAEAVP